MSNIDITSVDLGSVDLRDAEFQDDLLTFGGEGTVLAGTILARDSVSGKLVPFAKNGSTNENGIPKAVMTYSVSAAAAGDEGVRALVSGVIDATRLVIHADGDASNVDAPVLDQLRAYGITAIDVAQLAKFDNPAGAPEDS